MKPPAPLRGAAIIADIMVERALPVLLEPTLGNEHHVRIPEARHIAAEVAAIPRRLHAGDDLDDRFLLGGGVGRWRSLATGAEGEDERRNRISHRISAPVQLG